MTTALGRVQALSLSGPAIALVVLAFFVTTEAKIVRVPSEVPTIQEGLDRAAAGDTVLVDHGTYFENLIWPPTQDIKLYADEEVPPESTVISGTFAYLPVVEIATPIDLDTEIRCFIVENGRGDYGAGIHCSAGASPTIISNLFRYNIAGLYGGGVCCASGSPAICFNSFHGDSAEYGGAVAAIGRSAPLIENNFIDSCLAVEGGGVYVQDGATLKGNTIFQCTGNGAAMYLGGSALADSNFVTGNHGRAIYCAGSVSVKRSEINLNSDGGIYVAPGGTPLIQDNVIDWNTAANGGGIYSDYAYPTIQGNRIRHNEVRSHGIGGGLRIEHGAAVVESNKITHNKTDYEAAGIYTCGDSSTIERNNISFNTCRGGVGGGVFT